MFKPFYVPKLGRMLDWGYMQQEDIGAVHELEKRLFLSPWTKKMFLMELQQPGLRLSVVVKDKNVIAGYIFIHYIIDEIHIVNIAVAPEYQRCGIAQMILQNIIQAAAKAGYVRAHLEVRKSNLAAIALYQKLGFKIVGVRKNYYQAEKEDALLMSLELGSKE